MHPHLPPTVLKPALAILLGAEFGEAHHFFIGIEAQILVTHGCQVLILNLNFPI
jgi:hypothetical protein